jgi:hypothetical protein
MAGAALRKRQYLPEPEALDAANIAVVAVPVVVSVAAAMPAATALQPSAPSDPARQASGGAGSAPGLQGTPQPLRQVLAPARRAAPATGVASFVAAAGVGPDRPALATPAGATLAGTTAALAAAVVAGQWTPAVPSSLVAGAPAWVVDVARQLANAGLGAASLTAVERAVDDSQAMPLASLGMGGSPATPLALAAPGAAVATGPDARPALAASPPPVEPGLTPGRLQLDLQTADGAPIRVDMTFDAAGGAQLVVHAHSDATAGSLIERSAQLVDAMRDLGLTVEVDVRQGSGQPSDAAAGGGGGSAGSQRLTPDAVSGAGRAMAAVPVPARPPARSLDVSAALSFYA